MKQTTMWKLNNAIKNYSWGSTTALSELFNIDNPDHSPQAEIWMGTNAQGISTAIDRFGNQTPLSTLIAQNPQDMLGEETSNRYHHLPYLFKVLSADSPLSIQVHPNIDKAKQGYEIENRLAIPLDSANRNYKDPNHKPELIYALTPFRAMNGFRQTHEIISLFEKIAIGTLQKGLDSLIKQPTPVGLKLFFHFLLTLDSQLKEKAIAELMSKTELFQIRPFSIIQEIAKWYPYDIGLFSPLFLNVVELEPGQAMFLKPQTPHAYLQGTGLEIMANSDNVLRAGLTHKYIDVDAVLDNTHYQSISTEKLLTIPQIDNNKRIFSVPVNDFAFEMISSDKQLLTQKINSGEIIFCIKGQVTLSTQVDHFTVKAGESVFIASCAQSFSYQGDGLFARAYNPTALSGL